MVGAQKKPLGALHDHRRVGKKFIPPLVAELGPFREIRWVNDLVPELVWLAFLSERHGLETGTEMARRLALAAKEAQGPNRRGWFALASAYAELEAPERNTVVTTLEADGTAQLIREALSPLMTFYPEWPLSFLFSDRSHSADGSLEDLKGILASLFDKWDTPATFAQATAVYIAFVSDMLKVFEGQPLANFLAIEDFPNTEESQRVAGSVRSTVLVFYENFKTDKSTTWISYLWRRGLQLDDCKFDESQERAK